MFGTVLTSACTLMHVYVFWRAASVPFVKRHIPRKILILAGAVLWILFFTGRVYGHSGSGPLAAALELLGMNWMAALFLLFVCLLATDILTAYGYLMRRVAPSLRGWALMIGGVLSAIAVVQGLRPPVVERYEVYLPGLPAEMDGTVIVGISDLHLGSLIGQPWLAARVAQVQALQPDLVVLLGDIFEGHGRPQEEFLAVLRQLTPPLGVWAVPGNHESRSSLDLLEEAGFEVLSSSWSEVRPGLVLAGASASRRNEAGSDTLSRALSGRPPGATVLLSHRPRYQYCETAARAGVDLMLCGHTHGGQIWPFDYLVRLSNPLLEGRYDVEGMTVIVCRGTGTWGPRMRLWSPGEISRVILRAMEKRDTE